MQLKPPVQPPLLSPVGLLLVQPGFHTDASSPPQVLQNREVGPPDGVVGELDEAGAREIIALGAALKPLLGDAAVEGAGVAMRSRRTLTALAATTMAGFVQQQIAAIAAIQAAGSCVYPSLVWHLVFSY
jgi:hypothetical protein